MPRAISFSVTFTTQELARRFVERIILKFGSPTLRYETTVHTLAQNGDEMREILNIARDLGVVDL